MLLNTQETFDKIVAHLRQQNQKAINFCGTCMYKTREDLKCAIGCLIPDELYNKNIECRSIYDDQVNDILKKIINPNVSKGFLQELQKIHDHIDCEYWERHFELIASEYGLKYDH